MRWLLEGLPPGVKVWPSTLQSFRAMFRTVLEKARLTLPLTPGSLRAGGATWLVTSGTEIARIRFLGRWKSDTGLAAYIQEAVYHQRSYDVSGGMEFFGLVMGNRGRDLAWIFAIGAVFRVATYAALLARQPSSNWRKGALGGRMRAALAAGRRAPAGHVELAEVEVGRDSPAGARAEKVEHV